MILIPNVINADAFDVQAAVDESTPTGERFTWRRTPGEPVSVEPGVVVESDPNLHFPLPVAKGSNFAAIDAAASPNDRAAWVSAATTWIDYAERQVKDAREIWRQLEWGGAVSPDLLPPSRISLVNGATFGALTVLAAGGLNPNNSSWPAYFSSLRGALPAMTVSQAILTQIAMRSIAWTMQSLGSLNDTYSPGELAGICQIARAWQPVASSDCTDGEETTGGTGGRAGWKVALTVGGVAAVAAAATVAWSRFGR